MLGSTSLRNSANGSNSLAVEASERRWNYRSSIVGESPGVPVLRSVKPAVGAFGALSAAIIVAKYFAVARASEPALSSLSLPKLAFAAVSSSSDEIIIASVVCLLYSIALWMARSSKIARVGATMIFLGASAVIMAINVANVEIVRILGSPLSYGMVYYSDVFNSDNGRYAIASWIPAYFRWMLATILICSVGIYWVLTSFWNCTSLRVACSGCIAVVLTVAAMGFVKPVELRQTGYDRSGSASFLKSFGILRGASLLKGSAAMLPQESGPKVAGASALPAGSVQNVILVVLESVSQVYLDDSDAIGGADPMLRNLAANMLTVENAYSQAVSSNRSLEVLLSSRYPMVALQPAFENENLNPPFLPRVLSEAGISTAFFHSSDTRYGDADRFLRRSGYGLITDFRKRTCPHNLLNDPLQMNSQATPDVCTFAQLKDWINSVQPRPFFATLWTFQTHYPYYAKGAAGTSDRRDITAKEWLKEYKSRYLAALREANTEIARLLAFLRSEGLAGNTVVIVTGDHGQAFGQHGTFGHGSGLFEEDVRVPFLLINPSFRPEEKTSRISGHIDVAPTILDLLGMPVPTEWQGTSLFQPLGERPLYFFAPANLSIGGRLGSEKFTTHLLTGTTERFNLAADPRERFNLAASAPSQARLRHEQLLAWARWSNNSWLHLRSAKSLAR